MTDKEMTTVEEINARQAKYERFSDCSVDEMNELFDMARRFTTEIPKLEAELRDSVQLSDFHLETCRMRERSIKEYRERLATATTQVEQLEDQLVQTRAYYAQRDQRMREAITSYKTKMHEAARDHTKEHGRYDGETDVTEFGNAAIEELNDHLWEALEECQNHFKEALASHPADNDASKFVEKILGTVLRDIAAERSRQIEQEGWSLDHDDKYVDNELVDAAACYARGEVFGWPWDMKWWKPRSRKRDLIRAGALIVAELERMDRAAKHGIPLTPPKPEPDICMGCGEVDCGGACVRGA